MATGHLCDFCEILACWKWEWWGVLLQYAETKNYCSGNAKSKGGRGKTQGSFVDSQKSSMGKVSLVDMASTVC